MKVLLACDRKADPAQLAAYLAGRLDGRPVDIDVLTVIPGAAAPAVAGDTGRNTTVIAESGHEYRQACAYVATLAQELQKARPRSVRTHVEHGDPAEVILASSRLWRSELLLVGAPRRRGLLTAFRVDGVTRRLLNWSDCPVELLRAGSQPALEDLILLPLPLPLQEAAQLPLQRLAALPWRKHARVHLLGVAPAAIDERHAELSPAAALISLQHACDARTRASGTLADLQQQLSALLPPGIQYTHELAEGELREVVARRCSELQPSLLVLGQCCFGKASNNVFNALPSAALTLSVDCPVLLLQDGNTATVAQRKTEAARILTLAR